MKIVVQLVSKLALFFCLFFAKITITLKVISKDLIGVYLHAHVYELFHRVCETMVLGHKESSK
jgi:hypothetical protein